MTRPAALTAHDRFEVLALGRRVAADLAAQALDAASGLAVPDRVALARLSLALTAALSRIGRGGLTPDNHPAGRRRRADLRLPPCTPLN